MKSGALWDFIYKCQKNNNIDLDYCCRYSGCRNSKVIEILNTKELKTEYICKRCFKEDYWNYGYCVVLKTLFEEDYSEDSIFEKYGVNNEPKK